jgi:hypothetical protein
MGLVNQGVPKDLVLFIQKHFSPTTFVETGTYYGETAVWASKYFENVFTIEYAPSIYEKTLQKYENASNISFLFGDSRKVLKTIVPHLQSTSLFWLDGHYSGLNTYGQDDECPLLAELAVIQNSSCEHFVLIDDARLFMMPPPQPHKMAAWPTINKVFQSLISINRDYYVTIFEDVIIAIPPCAENVMANYFQDIVTQQWTSHLIERNQKPSIFTFTNKRILQKIGNWLQS